MSPTEYQEKPANSGWRGGKQLDAEPRARYRGFRRIALALHLDLMGGVNSARRAVRGIGTSISTYIRRIDTGRGDVPCGTAHGFVIVVSSPVSTCIEGVRP
jgi:hypothetical protein